MAQPGEKNITAYINPKVAEGFSEQSDERGYLKRKAIEGAIRAFMAIPPEAQVALMSNSDNPKDILVKAFRNEDCVVYNPDEFREKVSQICRELGVLRAKKKSRQKAKPSKP